ncbi:tumor necrosis factor receptor superfamily member 19-like protein [Labeo rohita]|uniref:Tumor necrosis factor receptor superfamily member 19-like protein n=1 Tax=Labeo rohita TaxID=84645 RepID=A0A498M4M9_LABRO|nr:tumor necrosis factor receptor superfamily member 19-like protein [Labeo rohita]
MQSVHLQIFGLSYGGVAGLGTGSDLSGEHTGAHPEQLSVRDGNLTNDSLSFAVVAEERRDCREQEYKDKFGNCIPCRQCDAGQELSKECGFGYGEDAQCVPCRASRFKEDRSLQKCKPCLDCSLLNRFQKGNCSTTSNAVCGDCLLGFYRKTKLSGFQDMECIPCGDPPPPYEPHCS